MRCVVFLRLRWSTLTSCTPWRPRSLSSTSLCVRPVRSTSLALSSAPLFAVSPCRPPTYQWKRMPLCSNHLFPQGTYTVTVYHFVRCVLLVVGYGWIFCVKITRNWTIYYFCFRESQRKTSGQSTGSSNDLQLQDESPLMGRNGIFCNLVHRVKVIRNRFFENAIYFSVKKRIYIFFSVF